VDTTHTSTKFVRAAVLADTVAAARRSRQMLIVLALALGAVLLTLSAPVVHAAPDDGTGSNAPGPQPLQVHASENPVVFLPWQKTKTITLTWTPQFDSNVVVHAYDNVNLLWDKEMAKGSSSLDLTVIYGKSYKVEVLWYDGTQHCPCAEVHITTEQPEPLQPQPLPLPQPRGINLPLIPWLPDLAGRDS
jgi:hypothetical protein